MIELRMLGQFDLQVDGQAVEITSGPAQALLAYLALNPGVEHRRDRLGGMMWPDAYDEASARNNLKQALYRLRQAIPEDVLHADKTSIGLIEGDSFWNDVAVLEAPVDEMASADDLREIVRVYTGELLPGFKDEWVDLERVRLHTVFEQRMRHFILLLTGEHRWKDVLEWAEKWIAESLAPEPAYRALMRAHAALGDLASMVGVYRRCERDMAELGVPVSVETQRLYEELANPDRTETPGKSVEAVTDITPVHNLPAQTTPLIGRQSDIEEAQALLDDPYCHLLTLVGPGGIGKTRLALEIAKARLNQYRDGVFFVPLASIEGRKLIAPAIGGAMSLGFHDTSDPFMQLMMYLADKQMLVILDNFEHLLHAVNLIPQIIEKAPGVTFLVTSRETLNLQGEFSLQVDGLVIGDTVNTDSALDLFVTYARRVNLGYEIEEEDLPHIVNICRYLGGMPLGIELAASWVKMLSPEEIAAEILHNIDFLTTNKPDVSERHRSMRAVFNHSWGRLEEDEQQVMAICAMFRGGFTREAAREVGGASLNTLMSLIDKSLMRPDDEGRYVIHEVIRQFALEHLSADAATLSSAQSRHALYYADFLRGQTQALMGGGIGKALEAIHLDRDNIRMGLDWILDSGEVDLLDGCLISLWIFYGIRGPIVEGSELFSQIAAQFDSLDNDMAQQAAVARLDFSFEASDRNTGQVLLDQMQDAGARSRLGVFFPILIDVAQEFLDIDSARGWLDLAVEHARDAGDAWQLGAALYIAGHHWLHTLEDPELAQTHLEESLLVLQQIDDRFWRTRVLTTLGILALKQGEYEIARGYLEDSIAFSQEIGGEGLIAWNYLMLGRVSAAQGEYRQAQRLYDQYLGDFREYRLRSMRGSALFAAANFATLIGDYNAAREQLESSYKATHANAKPSHRIFYLSTRGSLEHAQGKYDDAAKHLHEALQIAQEIHNDVGAQLVYNLLGRLALDNGSSEDALSYMQESLRASLSIGFMPEVLNTLLGMATVLVEVGESERAFQIVTLITRHRATDFATTERAVDLLMKLQESLPGDRVAILQDEMRTLELDQLIDELLADPEGRTI